MKAGLPLLGVAMLSACGAPQGAAPSRAQGGQVVLTRDGTVFVADLLQGGAGRALTAGGAVATSGLTVVVRGQDFGLGMDQGKLAKSLATEACTQAGGRPNPAALGRYATGQWQFAGACA